METAQFFNIQDLTFDPELQIRVKIDDERIAQYAECMATEEDMKTFPPVEIFYDGVKYWLADGHHRRAAAEMAGHSRIWAVIKSGTHDDALWAAIVGNGKQGFGLTKADRKRAIRLAITRWPDRSNVMLAEAIGCSDMTIKRHRDAISTSTNVEVEMRVGKDGKSRPVTQKSKTQKRVETSPDPKIEESSDVSTSDTTSEPTTEQQSQFRPGSLPTKKYVGETQLKPIPRDRPDILVANLLTFFPDEFVPNTAREIFRMLHEQEGKKVTKPLAVELYKKYGCRK